jgi:hypothetical protein
MAVLVHPTRSTGAGRPSSSTPRRTVHAAVRAAVSASSVQISSCDVKRLALLDQHRRASNHPGSLSDRGSHMGPRKEPRRVTGQLSETDRTCSNPSRHSLQPLPPRPEPVSAINVAQPDVPPGFCNTSSTKRPLGHAASAPPTRARPVDGPASNPPATTRPRDAPAASSPARRQRDAWIGAGAPGERPDGLVFHPAQRRPASDGGLGPILAGKRPWSRAVERPRCDAPGSWGPGTTRGGRRVPPEAGRQRPVPLLWCSRGLGNSGAGWKEATCWN